MTPNEADAELVSRFVERTRRPGTRKAGRLVGVSHTRVADWRNGLIGELMPDTREALRKYLAAPEDRGPAYIDGYAAALDDVRATLDEMEARIRTLGADVEVDALQAHDELTADLQDARDEVG